MLTPRLAAALFVLAAAIGATPFARAASSTASSASDSASSAASSTSNSIRRSSDGSSKATGVAQGDYRIIEVAAVAGEPTQQRLMLQALADNTEAGRFWLHLPQPVVARHALATGQVVSALHRPYGLEFAKADTREAFFLVLEDAWFRELPSRPVQL